MIVRARNELEARQLATRAFIIAVEVRPGRATVTEPWGNPQLVACTLLADSGYCEDGPLAVLSPEHQ